MADSHATVWIACLGRMVLCTRAVKPWKESGKSEALTMLSRLLTGYLLGKEKEGFESPTPDQNQELV